MSFWNRKAVVAGLLAGLAVSAPALARDEISVVDPVEMTEAEAIIAIMFPPDKRDEMMHDLMTDLSNQFSASVQLDQIEDSGVRSILESYLAGLPDALLPLASEHMPNLLNATAVAYVNRYSLAELQDIRAFAETPSGRHYFSSATALMSDPAVAAANTEYLGRLQELNQQLASGLRQQIFDYLQTHPEAAAAVRSQPS